MRFDRSSRAHEIASPLKIKSARRLPLQGAILALSISACPAHAQGITASTNVTLTSPAPSDVRTGKVQSATNVTAFDEQQAVFFTGTVDIAAPGTYGGSGNPLVPGTPTPVSQLVNSFFFYSDPPGGSTIFTGSITFDAPILGLEVVSSSLDSTDSALGLAGMGTTYPNGVANRGLEISHGASSDSITLSADRSTLTWSFNTGNSIDEVRVLTTAVPEPASYAAFAIGGFGLLGLSLKAHKRSTMA